MIAKEFAQRRGGKEERDAETQVLGKKGHRAEEGGAPVQTVTGAQPIRMLPSPSSPAPTCISLLRAVRDNWFCFRMSTGCLTV